MNLITGFNALIRYTFVHNWSNQYRIVESEQTIFSQMSLQSKIHFNQYLNQTSKIFII